MRTDLLRSIGSVVIAALLLICGAVVLWETTTYFDFDSAIFPRTVASLLVALCLIHILLWLMGLAAPSESAEPGSSPRRIGLVLLMLAGAFAMPWLGFILSALATFGCLTLLAMYEPWTRLRVIVYPLVGIAVVLGFYLLFGEILRVPLPVGSLFEG
jgi:hypothetical protein